MLYLSSDSYCLELAYKKVLFDSNKSPSYVV